MAEAHSCARRAVEMYQRVAPILLGIFIIAGELGVAQAGELRNVIQAGDLAKVGTTIEAGADVNEVDFMLG